MVLNSLLALLHAYIGVRLLAPFEPVAQVAGAALLVALFAMLPRGWWARERSSWRVMATWTATGFFSWLFVLTLLRDVALGVAGLGLDPATLAAWTRGSALAVMGLVPVITIVGYCMARGVAGVRRVDVGVEGLPDDLHGFTIAQITDL